METLIVTHDGCGGTLKHLHNRAGIRHNEIVQLEVFQCQKCQKVIDFEVPGEDLSEINLSFMS